MAEINVSEEVQRFKTEIVPLMNLNELEALQKFLKTEIQTREAQTPESRAIREGIRSAQGKPTRRAESKGGNVLSMMIREIREGRK